MKKTTSILAALAIVLGVCSYANASDQSDISSQKAVGILERIEKKLERIAAASERKQPIIFTLKSNVDSSDYWQRFYKPICEAAGLGKVLAQQETAHGYISVVCYE